MAKEYVWAMDSSGAPCKCYAKPENRGKGKCHHYCHADKGVTNVHEAMKQLCNEEKKQKIYEEQILIQGHEKNNVKNEKNILAAFPLGETVTINGDTYIVKEAGLPLEQESGNCKTDVYIKLEDKDGNEIEHKLSVKQSDYLYIENHMRDHRIQSLFGQTGEEFSVKALADKSDEWKASKAKTKLSKDGETLTIPFSYEYMLSRPDGRPNADTEILTDLPRETLENIYAGTELSEGKRDTFIGPNVIKDSGIANSYVVIDCYDKIPTAEEVINKSEKFDDNFYSKHNSFGLQTKSVNIRLKEKDGKFYAHTMSGTQLCRRSITYENGKVKIGKDIHPTPPEYITADNNGLNGLSSISGWSENAKTMGDDKEGKKWLEITEDSVFGRVIKEHKPKTLAELQQYITN